MLIRVADLSDAPAIAEIYAPNVADSFISFEETPPDGAEMAARMTAVLPKYPWLVAELDGGVQGYAYGRPHQPRAAYRWCVEAGVYIRRGLERRGLGRALYQRLFTLLRRQGFRMVYAGIALPNDASVGLHEAMGMAPLGVYAAAGFKQGAWRDVGWWQLDLGAPAVGVDGAPAEPIPFAELMRRDPDAAA
jgi:phosphinothricin acetyltransferase